MTEKYKFKKRLCAAVLAVSLVGQTLPAPVAFAADGQGGVELSAHLELPTKGKSFNVTLTPQGGNVTTMQTTLNAEGTMLSGQTKLAPGKYAIEIAAPGYLTYRQNLEIKEGMTTKLSLYNNQAVNDGVSETQKYGVMAVGDINGDNAINETDATLMMDAIDAQKIDNAYDLNGDAEVNIGDLTYITANYGANVPATPLEVLSGDQVKSEVEIGTVKEGNIADLTSGNEDTVVQLAPAKADAPISNDNPVVVDLAVEASDSSTVDGLVIAPPTGTDNLITDATIDVEDTTGNKYEAILTQSQPQTRGARVVTATQEKDGTIVVNLGQQIAIKKVTIKVTGASAKLVDIAQVEFVNGMENRIPEPEKSIPEIKALTQISAGNDPSFSVSWTPQVNITGYEVMVSGNGKEQVFSTKDTSLTVKEVGSAKLKSYVPYTVRVRSTNGDWKSSYSEAKTITIKPESVPPAPENLDVKGIVDGISVKWKAMRDTQTYSIYYRAERETDFKVIPNVTGTSYTIRNLTPNTTYELYMIGHNEHGDSPQSEHKEATPVNAKALLMPKYGLINTSNGKGETTAHIDDVTFSDITVENPFVIVDDSIDSYVEKDDWDWGWHYNQDKAPTITLDQEYRMDTIRFSGKSDYMDYANVRVTVWDAKGNSKEVIVHPGNTGSVRAKKDNNGNTYQELVFNEPENVKKIRIGLAHGSSRTGITISEVAFYHYDSLADDVDALFTDTSHMALKEGVNQEKIDALKVRANTPDASGETHPDKDSLLLTLAEAEELLKGGMVQDVIVVNNQVTAKADDHLDMAFPLSDLQPLGVTVQKNEALNVYVAAKGKKEGDSTNLKLVFTQTFGEASHWQTEIPLQVGTNAVTAEDVAGGVSEAGGAVYVRYDAEAGKEAYSVRVNGGTKIPVLDVSGKTDEARTKAIQAYVDKLGAYSQGLQEKHEEAGATDGSMHNGDYNAETCVFNVTDIVMNGMMYSVPADVVWNALNEKGNPTETLTQAITAMEQEVELLYQHKGLHKSETSGTDRFPAQRLNVRYQKMFDGAFMYAGGKHIGVGYSIAGILSKMTPVKTDGKGNASGNINLSGWGVAHEIGHVINNKYYTVGEVTNNYYSILATGDMRSDYDNEVYKAVTSGGTNDQRTALAMYWQLHMAFDNDGNFKTYDTADAMKKSLFFARMDSYSRKPDSAPKPKGEVLSLDSNSKSDNIIRLACAASEQNMLSFFEAWGFAYNDATKQYAEKFSKKVKDIQYLKPEAHAYRLAGKPRMSENTTVDAKLEYASQGEKSNKVTLCLSNSDKSEAMLGYEIRRNGEVVAFVPADKTSYVDTISTENNRVYNYEVTAYDKLLNKTDTVKLDPIKVTHDGTLGRDKWTATTNMTSEADKPVDDNCAKEDGTVEKVSAISRVIDGEGGTYTGKVSTGTPAITLKLGENSQVTALRYLGDPTDLKISVSEDGSSWTEVRSVTAAELNSDGQTVTINNDDSRTIFFVKKDAPGNLYVCQAAFVKVEMPKVAANTDVSIRNIDLLGPVGDNVEWLSEGNSIGKLKNDYQYGQNEDEKIPAGSIVFTGVYKGNPAFNVVVLKDENQNIVDGTQIIMAEAPMGEKLGDVSEGAWIYWIEPKDIPENLPTSKVKAELYRVDDAEKLTGERLVSDNLYHAVPAMDSMPEIELTHKASKSLDTVKAVQPKAYMEDKASNQGIVKSAMAAVASAVRNIVAQPAQAAEASAQTKAGKAPTFTMTSGDKNATLALNVGDAVHSTVALQAAIQVDGDATNATLNWDAALNDASLKAYRFDTKTKRLTLYVTAKKDLLNSGDLTIGTLQMDSTHGTKSVQLTLDSTHTMVVESSYAVNKLSGLASATHQLETNEAPSSGGSGGVVVPDYYDIAVESSVGGSVDVQPKQAKKGDTVTVTIAPKVGYIVETVVVTDAKGNNVAVQATGEQTYSFNMPASKVKVKAIFKQDGSEQPTPNNPFTDIAPSDYFYDSVLWAVDQNLVAGVADNLFAPQVPCTRAQMVVFLWRTHGCPQVEADLPFVDVPEDAYYADAVRWAVAEGVTGGTTATTFSPDMTLTRGQTVVFLHREAGSPIVEADGFSDVNADAYYADAVAWAVSEKITSGTGANLFSPDLNCTRGQIVCFLHNAEMAKERAAQ